MLLFAFYVHVPLWTNRSSHCAHRTCSFWGVENWVCLQYLKNYEWTSNAQSDRFLEISFVNKENITEFLFNAMDEKKYGRIKHLWNIKPEVSEIKQCICHSKFNRTAVFKN